MTELKLLEACLGLSSSNSNFPYSRLNCPRSRSNCLGLFFQRLLTKAGNNPGVHTRMLLSMIFDEICRIQSKTNIDAVSVKTLRILVKQIVFYKHPFFIGFNMFHMGVVKKKRVTILDKTEHTPFKVPPHVRNRTVIVVKLFKNKVTGVVYC